MDYGRVAFSRTLTRTFSYCHRSYVCRLSVTLSRRWTFSQYFCESLKTPRKYSQSFSKGLLCTCICEGVLKYRDFRFISPNDAR